MCANYLAIKGIWKKEEIGGLKLPMREIAAPSSSTCSRQQQQQPMVEIRKVRPQKDQALNCPRCHSTNTKFCYYNNYSLTQPRYFCKTCRRYWTEGGTLRNVPVGGGSRKNKRSCAAPTTSSHKLLPDLNPPPNIHHHHQFPSRNPNKILHEGQDLNLGFPAGSSQDHCYQANSQFFELPKMDDNQLMIKSSSSSTPTTPFAALELLRTGLIASRGMNSFITSITASPAPDLNAIYTSGFSFQDLKPAAAGSFSSVDGVLPLLHPKAGNGIDQENGGRLMFPFGAMKQVTASSTSTPEVDHHQNKGQPNSNGFWNGMLGGGSW